MTDPATGNCTLPQLLCTAPSIWYIDFCYRCETSQLLDATKYPHRCYTAADCSAISPKAGVASIGNGSICICNDRYFEAQSFGCSCSDSSMIVSFNENECLHDCPEGFYANGGRCALNQAQRSMLFLIPVIAVPTAAAAIGSYFAISKLTKGKKKQNKTPADTESGSQDSTPPLAQSQDDKVHGKKKRVKRRVNPKPGADIAEGGIQAATKAPDLSHVAQPIQAANPMHQQPQPIRTAEPGEATRKKRVKRIIRNENPAVGALE